MTLPAQGAERPHAAARTTDHADPHDLKAAMRRLVGGVAVITAGTGAERVGFTATSVTSLSVDPPTMLVCVNRTSSSLDVIRRRGHFCVNLLHARQQTVAERFAGQGGHRGAARYQGADWSVMGSGASGLAGALAILDCALEEIIERHSHAILLGAVREIRATPDGGDALVYGHGRFAAYGAP